MGNDVGDSVRHKPAVCDKERKQRREYGRE